VAPMADAGSWMNSDVKVYTTFVAIEGDTAKLNLRPGMSAMVEILVDELDDVLSVPVPAILQFKNKDYVFIKDGDGFRRAEVGLGISNDSHVEVKKGLKAGDLVAMSPNTMLTEDERREAFSNAAKDAAKKDFGGDPSAKGTATKGGPSAPGDGSAPAKGEGKAKGKRGGGGGAGGMMGSPEERTKFLKASPEEQRKILEDRGVPADRIDSILERMKSGGGPGGGGPGGGGFGGGGQGGPGQ